MPTAPHEPVTAARPRGSVTVRTSEARAPPEIRAVRWSGSTSTSFMPLRSITSPSHRARPAQSCPPPRTDKERAESRAARIANCTSCGVRQWATARGMRPIGFAQSAVAAIYRLSPGLETRPGSCPSSRQSVLSIERVIVLSLLRRARRLLDGNHQLAEPTQDVVQVASLLLDMESLHPRGQGAKDGVHFEPRQMLADTHVRSPAKCHVLCRTARHIEPVWSPKLAFVAIRRAIEHDRSRPRWKGDLVHIVISRQQTGEGLNGCFHPHNLVDGCGNSGRRLADLLPFLRVLGEQPNAVADGVNGRVQTGPHIIDHHHGANSLIDLAAIYGIEYRVRPASRLQLAADGLRARVMHHFSKDGECAAGAVVQRTEAVEHLRGPDQHSLTPVLGQSYRGRDDVHWQERGQFGDGAKRPLGHQSLDQPLRLRRNLLLERLQRRWTERFSDDATRALMVRAIAAKRISAQHLVHFVVHHNAGCRRERARIFHRPYHAVVSS